MEGAVHELCRLDRKGVKNFKSYKAKRRQSVREEVKNPQF
jgi:hypothetical protein